MDTEGSQAHHQTESAHKELLRGTTCPLFRLINLPGLLFVEAKKEDQKGNVSLSDVKRFECKTSTALGGAWMKGHFWLCSMACTVLPAEKPARMEHGRSARRHECPLCSVLRNISGHHFTPD